jgi:hypothetical protein
MKNVWPAFEKWEQSDNDLPPGYEDVQELQEKSPIGCNGNETQAPTQH